ncbi:hypothetical protein FQA39_LY02941 [Lamprigera yunnana]|nr:hypothetical protein FQA39_LY02941 [Lamprigera yunnana]
MKVIIVLGLLITVVTALPKRLVVPVKDARVGHSRIISGHPASDGQFPHQVSNEFVVAQGSSFCGGALISSRWVLTAGHCADGALSFTITLGTTHSTGDDPNGVVRRTTTAIVHEEYSLLFVWNDVALVDLLEDVVFTDVIQPIVLGTEHVGDGVRLTVSGWGKTSDASNEKSPTLNFVDLDTISNSKCREVYGITITDKSICCIGHPEHSPCSGDSGGPLVKYYDGIPQHIGVVSFVHDLGCASGNPSGYARTASYIPWIENHTGPL